MRSDVSIRSFLIALLAAGWLLASCGAGAEGERILRERCTSCHEKAEVVAIGRTGDDWARIVNQMVVFGAELDEDEKSVLVDYLAETYGP